jgi:hypothetical protein
VHALKLYGKVRSALKRADLSLTAPMLGKPQLLRMTQMAV